MTKNAFDGVVHHLRKLAFVGTKSEATDAELLDLFVHNRDEGAFTVLVERHGPMVHSVCSRMSHDSHDADDACQATFLVLARKATSIRKQDSLASWLHGVARRISSNLQRERRRRQQREANGEQPPATTSEDDLTWREVRAILDEELGQLPERNRAALILCYLEGKTRDEAARQLGLSAGSLHGLLQRGRDLLRQRLVERGVTLSSAVLLTTLGEGVARAKLAPTLVVASVRAASAYLDGAGVVDGVLSPQVLSLTQEVLRTMFLTKVKTAVQMFVCAGLLVALVGGVLSSTGHAQPGPNADPFSKSDKKADSQDSDEAFLRRMSQALRGHEPSPTEVHFFVVSKDPNKRKTIVDLLVKERLAKKGADPFANTPKADARRLTGELAQWWLRRTFAQRQEAERAKQAEAEALRATRLAEAAKARKMAAQADALTQRLALEKELAKAQVEADRAKALVAQANAQLEAAQNEAKQAQDRAKALERATRDRALEAEAARMQAEAALQQARDQLRKLLEKRKK